MVCVLVSNTTLTTSLKEVRFQRSFDFITIFFSGFVSDWRVQIFHCGCGGNVLKQFSPWTKLLKLIRYIFPCLFFHRFFSPLFPSFYAFIHLFTHVHQCSQLFSVMAYFPYCSINAHVFLHLDMYFPVHQPLKILHDKITITGQPIFTCITTLVVFHLLPSSLVHCFYRSYEEDDLHTVRKPPIDVIPSHALIVALSHRFLRIYFKQLLSYF